MHRVWTKNEQLDAMAFGGARGRASHEEWIGGRLRSQRSRGVVGVRRGYQVLLGLGRDANWCGRELEMRGRGAVGHTCKGLQRIGKDCIMYSKVVDRDWMKIQGRCF